MGLRALLPLLGAQCLVRQLSVWKCRQSPAPLQVVQTRLWQATLGLLCPSAVLCLGHGSITLVVSRHVKASRQSLGLLGVVGLLPLPGLFINVSKLFFFFLLM